MKNPAYRNVFKRVETDREFRRRLPGEGVGTIGLYGVALDDHAWGQHKMQRRIVEDVA